MRLQLYMYSTGTCCTSGNVICDCNNLPEFSNFFSDGRAPAAAGATSTAIPAVCVVCARSYRRTK